MNDSDRIRQSVEKYGDMLYRICLVMLKNSADAEDAVQSVFMKLFMKVPQFESDEHEKAWLIRVATNKCRDMLRFRIKFHPIDDETLNSIAADEESTRLIELLTELPRNSDLCSRFTISRDTRWTR